MRRILLASFSVFMLGAAMAQAEYRLTILHTNDFHSSFEPLDRFDRVCPEEDNTAGHCFGGAVRIATAIAEARTRAANSVLLDAGDQFPALKDKDLARPELLATLMNQMGYDAFSPGSHEFDEGPEVAGRFLSGLDFPSLMANGDLSGEPLLAEAVRKSTVIERGGEKLGIIGLTPEASNYWRGVDYIVVSDPVAAVQAEANKLTAQGVDKIIVLSHAGLYADQKIARGTTGVDVIVGGHSHTYLTNTLSPSQGPYPTMENGVAIVHAFPFGTTVGELRVVFDDEGNVTSAVGDQILLDAGVAEDPMIKTLVDKALAGNN